MEGKKAKEGKEVVEELVRIQTLQVAQKKRIH